MLNFDRTNYFDSNNPNEYLKRSKKEKQENLNYLKTLEFTKGKRNLICCSDIDEMTIYINLEKYYNRLKKDKIYHIKFYPYNYQAIKRCYGLKDEEYKDLIESIKIKDKED